MAEWSIAAVLKTVEPKGSGGSNPSLSDGPSCGNVIFPFDEILGDEADFIR